MSHKNHNAIKDEILKYAMGLWGITDARDMDPVLDLLLDVFAYESFKLHEYVEDSDAKILSRLSRILVASKWSLPKPAHA